MLISACKIINNKNWVCSLHPGGGPNRYICSGCKNNLSGRINSGKPKVIGTQFGTHAQPHHEATTLFSGPNSTRKYHKTFSCNFFGVSQHYDPTTVFARLCVFGGLCVDM